MYVRTEMFSLDWLCGMYIRTEMYSLDWLCVIYIHKCFSGIHRVGCTYLRKWFLGFTVWDVHTYGNDFRDSPCGMYIPTEMISGIHHVGCTYLRKWFLGFTLWDVHTYGNDWVSMPRPIAHGPSLGPRRAYPRRFLGRTPYRTHSLGDGSKCRRGKGF